MKHEIEITDEEVAARTRPSEFELRAVKAGAAQMPEHGDGLTVSQNNIGRKEKVTVVANSQQGVRQVGVVRG